MGCDIHMHSERFVDGRWVHLKKDPYHRRDYWLFWILGGVRRRGYWEVKPDPIAKRRGVPADISPETRKDWEIWDSDAHSANWLSLTELEDFARTHPAEIENTPAFWKDTLAELRGCSFHTDCKQLDELGAACIGSTDNVRIVFWFDN